VPCRAAAGGATRWRPAAGPVRFWGSSGRLLPPDTSGPSPETAAIPRHEWSGSMAKGKKKLEVVHLVCEETGDQNYTLRRKTGGEKLKVKKYSPRLRKHTLHNEKRK
jgi:large subunit ribosomal protein L33